jgi:hypothetical protein
MNTRRALSAIIPLVLLSALAACEDDETAATVTIGTETTTTVGAGGSAASSATDAPVASDPPSATAPVAPPDTAPSPTTPPITTPEATAARPPAAPMPGADSATGLSAGPLVPAPDGITVDDTIKGEAMITIDGPFPLSLSGGLCSFVDTTLFIQAGSPGGGNGDFISLSFITADQSLAAITDTAHITAELLQWQSGSKTAMSLPGDIDIIFDGAGISGSFAGIAAIAGPSTPTGKIEFGGRFSCTPAPFEIRGAQALHLTEAHCNSADSYVSAGSPTGDAALLAFDPTSLSAGDTTTNAALTFRIGGVEYTSVWALAEIDPDGLGATFRAMMVGPDGVQFRVDGGFSCI